MKKIKFLIVFVLLFIPSTVLGYGIENYYMNATVLENGDLEVEEYFELNGSYNGMERIIKYKNINSVAFDSNSSSYGGSSIHNGDGIDILKVGSTDINHSFSFNDSKINYFKKVDNASKGDNGVYTDEYNYGGRTIRIFLPSNKNKAFYVKYRLYNMAILHNDIGELGWNIFGKQMNESIGNLVAYINVPNNKNMMKAWAHGPLNGNVEIVSSNTVKVSIRGLNSNTAIDARLAFDKESISSSTKKTNVDALDKIILYETDLAEEANRQRQISDQNNIAQIKEYFSLLAKTPSRENYNKIIDTIYLLNDKDKQSEFLELLKKYDDEVNQYEYKMFKSYLDNDLSIENYKEAEKRINNVYDKALILKIEKELDEYYKRLQKKDLTTELIMSGISLGTILITLIAYYVIPLRKKRVSPYYFRDIPSDLPPACVGLLVDKKITKNEVSASILDLIIRKIIIIEKQEDNSYDFVLTTDYDKLSDYDKVLFSLIFVNKGVTRINSKKIRKIHITTFKKFKKAVADELTHRNLMVDYLEDFDEVNGIILELGLIALVTPLRLIGCVLIFVYSLLRYHEHFYLWLFVLLNIALIVMSIILNSTVFHISIILSLISIVYIKIKIKYFPMKLNINYTKPGKEEMKLWHGVRNFLIDFSKINDREIKEINVWEKYLVYATALGVSKKVLDTIKVNIEQLDINNDYDLLTDFANYNMVSSSINRISNSIVRTSLPTTTFPIFESFLEGASSGGSYSSGSGGGGGFSGGSSGGGSFGGGGGGGRF